MDPDESTNGLGGIEEFFPTNRIEIINQNIANNDAKTIHDKMEQYEQLDSEQRYPLPHPGARSSGTSPCCSNSSPRKESPSSSPSSTKW